MVPSGAAVLYICIVSVREQRGGVVAVAAVGQQGHDRLALVLGAAGKLDGRVQRGARGDAHGDALLLCQQLGPQAIQALARFNVRAFDIALPISDAIAKINLYRNKIAQRALKIKESIE